jgi:hypothetical protein
MAAVLTGLVALWEASVVVDMIPDATVVDVVVLILTGFLSGLFAGFHIMQAKGRERIG